MKKRWRGDRGYVYQSVMLLWFGADDVSLQSQTILMCGEADGLQYVEYYILQPCGPRGHTHHGEGQHCLASLKPSFHLCLLTLRTSCQSEPVVCKINWEMMNETENKKQHVLQHITGRL